MSTYMQPDLKMSCYPICCDVTAIITTILSTFQIFSDPENTSHL